MEKDITGMQIMKNYINFYMSMHVQIKTKQTVQITLYVCEGREGSKNEV